MSTAPESGPFDTGRAFATAREHHMAGRLEAAERLYQQILDEEPEHPDALHLLGVMRWQQKQFAKSIELIGRAIDRNPDEAKYHSNLGNALRDAGRAEEAVASYRRALELDQDLADAHHNLGTVLGDMGKTGEGIAALERALALRADFAPTYGNLSMLLGESGRLEDAVAACRKALALAPAQAEYQMNLASILLRNGKASEALEVCETCLAAGQQTTRSLALKGIALTELHQTEAARALIDPDLIEARVVELLPGQGSIEAFNRRLAAHVAAHPSLVRSPPQHATRHGWHSGELANDPAPEIDILKEMISAAVRRRFENPPQDSAHPFWVSRSDTFGMRIWAVVMERGGHQVAHIHPAAWLSGVYYVELPPDV
ncbi:MAG: tetratricopeptide repeat protein, partial [Alphaproteobacteria bacterium]